ncbi:hypothetical protein [Flexithrix dorotheae]|uniref:hypothetical protein n=1 Tax=Flexithrix dorotheae TaxID=70993 RepID=UPI00036CAB9B|nr:hypothetical protein [Flexithrix dorotheae]
MKYTFAVISTFSILLPIILNLWVFKKASINIRLFLFFLVFGFFTDALGWYQYEYQNESNILNLVSQFLYQAYPLFEVLFFFVFLWSLSIKRRLKKTLLFFAISILPCWLVYNYLISLILPSLDKPD